MNLPVATRFRVIDECADWVVVDKPAPLIVHPTNNHDEPTLLGGLQHLLAYDIANGAKLYFVNRLDRDTSGIVLVAKTLAAARELGMMFERREVEKEYLAIVHGWPVEDSWVCAEPIRRAGEFLESGIWVKQAVDPAGKPCRTRFSVETRVSHPQGKFALVRCFPETGRMHQIRVHLAHAGQPIAGDKIYSGDGSEYLEWMRDGWTDSLARRLPMHRHALHATRLGLKWRGIPFTWESPLPDDMASYLSGRNPECPELVIWNRRS